MEQQAEIAGQLNVACQRSGFTPSRLDVLSYVVVEPNSFSLVTYLVLVKKLVRRASWKHPGKYWQVTSHSLVFVMLNSKTGEKFSTRHGVELSRADVLRANRILKEGSNPIEKMDVSAISQWNDKERTSLSKSIWLSA